MKRSFLAGLGLEKELVDQIMKEHGATVEGLKCGPQSAAYEALRAEMETWKQKHEQEAAAHLATREQHSAAEDRGETMTLLHAALAEEGANPRVIPLLVKDIDPDAVRKKDGALENRAELIAPIRERYGDFFGGVVKQGADVGTPPAEYTGAGDAFLAGFAR